MSLKIKNLIIIDSNFILLPYQFKIDYLNDIYLSLAGKTRFYVFKQSFDELEAKTLRNPKAIKFKKQYKSGMDYLETMEKKYPLYFVDDVKKSDETTDDFLLRRAKDFKKEFKHVYLATNDSELRYRAKKNGISVIFLRQKKFLSIERS